MVIYIHDFSYPSFSGQNSVSCSAFHRLFCKVQSPVEVDICSINLQIVRLCSRIWHVLPLYLDWIESVTR